ncbi:short coiled-coil protein B-like isoform X2 [Watersipora subatra]
MSDEDLDPEMAQEVQEEKKHLIGQILDLQNTLDEFSSKVDTVKEENLKLKAENQVLGQYIESLMTASTMFQSTDN